MRGPEAQQQKGRGTMMRTADSLFAGRGWMLRPRGQYLRNACEGGTLQWGDDGIVFFFSVLRVQGEAWDGVNARSKFSVR